VLSRAGRSAPLSKDLCAARKAAQLCGRILHFACGEPRAPDEEDPDVRAQLMLHMAICLTQETLRAAAHGGAAEFFPGGKADFARDARIAQNVEDHSPPRHNRAVLIDILKIAPPLNDLRARQRVSLFFHIVKKEVTRGDLLLKVQRNYAESFFLPR